MATAFEVQQRFSQDMMGKTLTLIDFSNYNGILPVADDPYVNSTGNTDAISINDFVDRRWYLQDLAGNIQEVVFPYDLPQLNKCSILIDRDKYLSVTLVIRTVTSEFQLTTPLLANRRAEYKLYVLSGYKKSCCTNLQQVQLKIDATNLMHSAVFKVKHYDESGSEEDIIAANKLLDSVV